jgi:hypothetical protein
MLKYWSVSLVGSDVLCRSWISWYMGLCSPVCCSGMSCLWWWYDWTHNCSYGTNSVALLIWFSKFMLSLIGPYSSLLFRMCNAYAVWGSLCFMYLICSWYMCLRLRLACPMYDILHVLHVSLWITLLSYYCVLLIVLAFVSCCKVLVFLKDIPNLCAWISWWSFLLLACNMWMFPRFFYFFH